MTLHRSVGTTIEDPRLSRLKEMFDLSLLIVDDDSIFLSRLCKAMASRGFNVASAETIEEALVRARRRPPAFAVLDVRLGDANGLDLVDPLRKLRSDCRIVMLTSYGDFASVVAAIRHGAIDYMAKPTDADEIAAALIETERMLPKPPRRARLPNDARLAHIRSVYEQCGFNKSMAARRLRMHRRTLQRILNKSA